MISGSEPKSETKKESSIMDVGDSQASMLATSSQDDTNGSEEKIENGGVSQRNIFD
jgi:hypothetical protein